MKATHTILDTTTYEGTAVTCRIADCRWKLGPIEGHNPSIGALVYRIGKHHQNRPQLDEQTELPPGIRGILDYLIENARFYKGLHWREEAEFKSDLMENRSRWMRAPAGLVLKYLIESDMKSEDVILLLDYLIRAQEGRTLRANSSYRGKALDHEVYGRRYI